MLLEWEKIPAKIRNDKVRNYYVELINKKEQLIIKRIIDIILALALIIIFSPVFVLIAIFIKLDSRGPVFFRQIRITQYGKEFRIHKFRSMYVNSEKKGQITEESDSRITKVGKFIRKYKLDELGQLIDVLQGTMSFVGTRPEVPRYVDNYTEEMFATLLLPAGITSTASLLFKNENEMLKKNYDIDKIYCKEILPKKMDYNLNDIKNFSIVNDFRIMLKTVSVLIGR